MKKILLSSMVLFSVLATAQNKTMINTAPTDAVPHFKKISVAEHKKTNSFFANKASNMPGSAWFNQVDFLEFIQPQVQVFSAMHVFPDSSIILGFTSTNAIVNPWIHQAAVYVDPSFMIQQSYITDKTVNYTCDSISVGYLYERHSSNSITDSLIFQVVGENHNLDYTLGASFPYQDITYNYNTNSVQGNGGANSPILKRVAVALNIQDTCEGGVYKQIKVATPGIPVQTLGKKIGVTVKYKPGYTYTINDTLIGGSSKNIFFILSSEQNGDGGGAGTDPTIFGVPSDYTSDMSMSYIISTDIRYNISSNGWNGYFIPTYAYTTPFAYESHDIGFKLTNITIGVKELENTGFALGQNAPNPFSKESFVNYQLANDANIVTFTVTDVTGRIISSEKVNSAKGSHSVKLGAYAAGLYYYSLNVDGKTTSKKMIVE